MDMGAVRSQWGNRGGGDRSGGDALPHPRMGRWLPWKLHESWFLVVAMDMGVVRSQWGNRGGGRGYPGGDHSGGDGWEGD
ncbi:unnamed protein product [Musa acuminata subsp. burmannicoides]